MLNAAYVMGQISTTRRVPRVKDLLLTRRVLVCAGSGGVGKTSVAAALGLLGAQLGRRVLALTVDPAKRLAESLGVDPVNHERQFVARERLLRLGVPAEGELSVLVLDPEHTLNELVRRLAPDAAAMDRIVNHPLYRYFASYLAGANEYMAMEKLLSVLENEDYDLLILDTPPTRHALDFLNAPERLTSALDGPVVGALVKAVSGTHRFSLDLVARSAAKLLRGFGKVTGTGTLEQVATFALHLNAIFGGFQARATRVASAFRASNFAYLVVVRPEAGAVDDGLYFVRALADRDMAVSTIVVNRVHERPDAQLLKRGLQQLRAVLPAGQLVEVERVLSEHVALNHAESLQLERLWSATDSQACDVIELPALSLGVKSLETLSDLAAAFR